MYPHQETIAKKKREEEPIEMAKQLYNMKFTKKENKIIGTFFGQDASKPLPKNYHNNLTIYKKYLRFCRSKKFITLRKEALLKNIKNSTTDEIEGIITELGHRFIVERYLRYYIQYLCGEDMEHRITKLDKKKTKPQQRV